MYTATTAQTKAMESKIRLLELENSDLRNVLGEADTRLLSLRLKLEDIIKYGVDGFDWEQELEMTNRIYTLTKSTLKKYEI